MWRSCPCPCSQPCRSFQSANVYGMQKMKKGLEIKTTITLTREQLDFARSTQRIPFATELNELGCSLRDVNLVSLASALHASRRIDRLYKSKGKMAAGHETTFEQIKMGTKKTASTSLTSPKSWNRDFSPRSTPAMVDPEFNPTKWRQWRENVS
jgi:hypothetical protein